MTKTAPYPTRQINTLASHTGPINCIAFSNLGGTYILTGSSDRSIQLSRTEPSISSQFSLSSASTSASTSSSTPLSTPPIQKYTSHGYPVLSISVSSQNTHFASTGGDRAVFYWDIQTPSNTVRRFGSNTNQAHTSRITCVAFTGQDDNLLVSGSDDRTVRLWDVKSRDTRPLQILEEAKDSISSLVVYGTDVIVGSVDGRVRTYDFRTGSVTTDVQAGSVTSLDLSVDGKMVLVGCLDGKLRVMDRINGQLLKLLPTADDNNTNTDTSVYKTSNHQSLPGADNNSSNSSNSGGNNTNNNNIKSYKNESLRLQSCFGADAALVLSGSEGDGRVRIWDILTGKMIGAPNVSPNDKVVSVVKWREGSRSQGRSSVWASGGVDGVVRIYG